MHCIQLYICLYLNTSWYKGSRRCDTEQNGSSRPQNGGRNQVPELPRAPSAHRRAHTQAFSRASHLWSQNARELQAQVLPGRRCAPWPAFFSQTLTRHRGRLARETSLATIVDQRWMELSHNPGPALLSKCVLG